MNYFHLFTCCYLLASLPLIAAIDLGFLSSDFFGFFGGRKSQDEEHHIRFEASETRNSLTQKLYGQPLVIDFVIQAIAGHFNDDSPRKALVISFHGMTGTGKYHVSKMLAKGMLDGNKQSKCISWLVANIDFPDAMLVDVYRENLRSWIRGNVTNCDRTLFIFDEFNHMPEGIIDAISPFIDHHKSISGVDYRKSTFIFLSNTGGEEIANKLTILKKNGKKREDIKYIDMYDLIRKVAFRKKGGFHNSDLVKRSLVDFYIPFLPLERKHVTLCALDELKQLHVTSPNIDKIAKNIADSMTYFPSDNPTYSISGCRGVRNLVLAYIVKQSEEDLF